MSGDSDAVQHFEDLLSDTVRSLEGYRHETGDATEKRVAKALRETFPSEWEVHHRGGRHFPDCLIRHAYAGEFGVEIKGAGEEASHTPGNSIMDASSPGVAPERTYLVVVRGRGAVWHRYFDRVVDVRVTHSPRWYLDISDAPEPGLFEHDNDLSLDDYGRPEFVADVIADMRSRTIEQGKMAWWITESDPEPVAPLEIVRLKDLTEAKRQHLLTVAFILFTEDLLKGRYNECFSWALSRHGVNLTRDAFTAGGQVPLPPLECAYGHALCKVRRNTFTAWESFHAARRWPVVRIYRGELPPRLSRVSASELIGLAKTGVRSTSFEFTRLVELDDLVEPLCEDCHRHGGSAISERIKRLLCDQIEALSIEIVD